MGIRLCWADAKEQERGVHAGEEALGEPEGDAAAPFEGPLTAHLEQMKRIFPGSERQRQQHPLIGWLSGNKVTIAMEFFYILLELFDIAVATSLDSIKFPMRIILAIYSCTWAQVVFVRRSAPLLESFGQIVMLVKVLEQRGVQKSKESMKRRTKQLRRLVVFYVVYGGTLQIGIFGAYALIEQNFPKVVVNAVLPSYSNMEILGASRAEQKSVLIEWVRWGVFPMQFIAAFINNAAMHGLVVMLLTIYTAATEVWHAIGLGVQAGDCTPLLLSAQGTLTNALFNIDKAMFAMMPHLLVVTIVLPLLSTVELVTSGMRADLFSVGTAPLILTLFMPLCLAGDTLAAARRGVCGRAYAGPWPEEAPLQRRQRLRVMQAASGGIALRGQGIGNLDRRACYRALKSWFSFLQFLINVSR